MNPFDSICNTITKGNSRSVTVKKNIVGSLFLKGISILVSLMLVPATIGYVNAELYGVWLALASMMTWLGFADIGFTQGLKNKLTEAIAVGDWEKGRSLVSTTYFMMALIFVPVCIILELLVPLVHWTELLHVSEVYEDEIVRVMYVVVGLTCLQMIVNVLVSVIAAFQKVALSSSFVVIGNIISLVIIYVLRATAPPSLLALALSLAMMPILVTLIASFILYGKNFKKVAPSLSCVNRAYVKDLFSLGYKFFIINIQVLVLYQSTNILIANVSSPLEVTHYNIAYKLLNCAMMVYTIITAPLWPAYTDAYARGDYDWMKRMRKKMEKILLVSIGGCVLLVVLSQQIYDLWVGDSVSIPFAMTALVALYVIAYCWMNLNGTLIVGMGKVQVETVIVVIGMMIHIPLSLILSQHIGAYGVLVSLIGINLFYAVVMNVQVGKLLNKTAIGFWDR